MTPALAHQKYKFLFAFLTFLLPFFFSTVVAASESCEPQFPFKEPWLGSDAAYSIPLPDGRSVWIFGDTLTGDKRVVVENEPRMVRNSIAISRCTGKGFQLDYIIRRGPGNDLQDFFKARKKDTWYWALDGFYHDDALWVTLLCLRAVPVTSSATLGFETCGSDLAKLTGLAKDPQQWEVSVQSLVEDGVKAYPSATTLAHDGFAYLFALYESGSRPLVATRIPLSGLGEAAKNLQYLSKDGSWKPGFDPKNAAPVMRSGNTELTIRYHPGLKQWLGVMNDPKLMSGYLVVRTSPSLTGPWSEGQKIYSFPEMQKDKPGYDSDTFCYAGKEHPEFRNSTSILVTYACNTAKVEKLATRNDIYFPQVIRVPLSTLTHQTQKITK